MITEEQDKIVSEFEILDGDQEMMNYYLMELGQKLPPFPEAERKEENLVNGCQSKVWLHARLNNGKVYFDADSNTAITKGLVALLVRVLSGNTTMEIINAKIDFPERIGMGRFIGTQRSNGFNAMTKQFKVYAVALKAKMELENR